MTSSYLKKIIDRNQKYILPSLSNLDIKDINASMLNELLGSIYNKNNPNTSRLDTIHRLIWDLKEIFRIPLIDGYISQDPTLGIQKNFLTKATSTTYLTKTKLL